MGMKAKGGMGGGTRVVVGKRRGFLKEGERFFICLPLGKLFERTIVASTTFSLVFFLPKIGGNNLTLVFFFDHLFYCFREKLRFDSLSLIVVIVDINYSCMYAIIGG